MDQRPQARDAIDRFAHRLLEDFAEDVVRAYYGLQGGEATVTPIDPKLTAFPLRIADKIFLVTRYVTQDVSR